MEPFHEEADARSTAGLSTDCTVSRCGLFVAQARMASGSVHSEKALTGKTRKETGLKDF
jgi:hypothetical protein